MIIHGMNELREKTIKVLESLEKYYRNLGAYNTPSQNAYNTVAQKIQVQYKKLSHESIFQLLEIVNKYRKDLDSLDIQKFSRMRYDRIRLLLDKLISVLRMRHLLEMLEGYVDDPNDFSRKFNLEQLEYDHQNNHSGVTYEAEDGQDGLEAIVETLEEYAEDDDVYVG